MEKWIFVENNYVFRMSWVQCVLKPLRASNQALNLFGEGSFDYIMLLECYFFLLTLQISLTFQIYFAFKMRSQYKTTITPFLMSIILSIIFCIPVTILYLKYFIISLNRKIHLWGIRGLFILIIYLAINGIIIGLYISPKTNLI